jgi:hypothetical protein
MFGDRVGRLESDAIGSLSEIFTGREDSLRGRISRLSSGGWREIRASASAHSSGGSCASLEPSHLLSDLSAVPVPRPSKHGLAGLRVPRLGLWPGQGGRRQ